MARNGRWYLIAWDLDASDWRIYRLDKITPKFAGGAVFAPRPIPTGDAQTFLSARSKGSHTQDVWPCYGEFLLDLPAHDIAPWLGDGDMEPVSDFRCRVRAGSWSWTGLLAWIIRFDAPFTILGPQALIDAATGLSTRVAEATRSLAPAPTGAHHDDNS